MQSNRLVIVLYQQGFVSIILYRLLIEFSIRIWKGTENGELSLQNLLYSFGYYGFHTDFYSKALFFVLFSKRGSYFENGILGNLHICMN